jgi:hypothetical protein
MAVYESRTWDWKKDGDLDGKYIETRSVHVNSGPSAGQSKLLFEFRLSTGELVDVWETAVLKSRFRRELELRGKPDFEAGERIQITPKGMREGPNGTYRDFDVTFEHAAPEPTLRDLLGGGGESEPSGAADTFGPPADRDGLEPFKSITERAAEKRAEHKRAS